MGVLDRFERRLEGLVSGAFARAFKSEVQPVEVASSLQREMDNHAAIVGPGRTYVPNDFTVELGPSDHDRLAVYSEALGNELGAMANEHAAEQGYTLIGAVRVRFERQDDLDTGVFRVRGTALSGGLPGPESRADQRPRLESAQATFVLSSPVTVIGRGSEADIRLDDPGVSRRHAEVRLNPGNTGLGASIVDLGSTNGTTVDGRQIGESTLADGVEVVIGQTRLMYRHGEAGRG